MQLVSIRLVAALFAVLNFGPAPALLPGTPCPEVHDAPRCLSAGPKDWSDEERRVMRLTLDRLMTNELVRGIVAGAADNGYHGLQRYKTDTQPDATGAPSVKFGPGFVLYQSKVIGITDAFFALAEVRDGLGGHRVGDVVLVHELIHAFDDRRRSITPEFTALSGWAFDGGRWQYKNRVNFSAYQGVFAETLTLYARGRYEEAWTRDRAFATTLHFPLPRIQSLVTPAESFADILAHLIVDPSARTYLRPAVAEWFERRIYPTLREYASRSPRQLGG